MRKRRILACVAACAALASAASAQRYVCFGDSITLGIGDGANDDGGGYPARLETALVAAGRTVTVENLGIDGETTSAGLSRLSSVSGASGDVLILMEGTNDVAQRVSSETLLNNLQAMVQKGRSKGFGTVMLATLIPRPNSAPSRYIRETAYVDEQIRQLAYDLDAPQPETYQPIVDTPTALDTFYISDTVHLTPEGYDLLGEVFADFVLDDDVIAPVPSFVDPADGTTGVSTNAELQVILFDSQSGVDRSTATLTVNDTSISTTVSGDGRRTVLTARPGNLAGAPRIGVDAIDLASPPNRRREQVAQVTVKGAQFLAGDIDLDGRVDGTDLVRLGLAFGAKRGDGNYDSAADLDGNSTVDGSDLAILASNFGLSS